MKYYYLVNGEVKSEYDSMETLNLLFYLTKTDMQSNNHLSWYRESKDIKVLRVPNEIHVFCTEEHLNEFIKLIKTK